MQFRCIVRLAGLFLPLPALVLLLHCRPATRLAALPEIRQLVREVLDHQKQLDQVRENYTYSSLQTTQDIDAADRSRRPRRGARGLFRQRPPGRAHREEKRPALSDHDQQKETERVTKMVEKAEKTPRDLPSKDQHQRHPGS